MIEITKNKKEFKVIIETTTTTEYKIVAHSEKEATEMVSSGSRIGKPVWKLSAIEVTKILKVEEIK